MKGSIHYVVKNSLLQGICCLLLLTAGCRAKNAAPALHAAALRFTADEWRDIAPCWSHNGKRIAFLRLSPNHKLQLMQANASLGHIQALLKPETVTPDRPFAASHSLYCCPDRLAWSFHDRRIAFERVEWFRFPDGADLPGTGLWAFDLHSRLVLPLALHPKAYHGIFYYYHSPAWSPDGKMLAFAGEGLNGQRAIFVRPLRSEPPTKIEPLFDKFEESDFPTWAPQSKEALAFCRLEPGVPFSAVRTSLWVVRPGSPNMRESGMIWRMSAHNLKQKQTASRPNPRMGAPAWSPDGSKIALTLAANPLKLSSYSIWVVNVLSRHAVQVTPAGKNGFLYPVWIGEDKLGLLQTSSKGYRVVTLNLGTSTLRCIGTLPNADCCWSPDRSRIVYAGVRDNYFFGKSGTTLRMLYTGVHADNHSETY